MTTNATTRPSPSLYDIAQEHREIYDILIENDGELTPELEERLDTVLRQGRDKLDAAAAVVRRLNSEAAYCDAEAQRLVERKAAFERDAQRLKDRMLIIIDQMYGGKFKSPVTTAWGQTSPDTVGFQPAADADLNQMDDAILRKSVDLNRLELQRRYKAGEPIPPEIQIIDKPGTRYLRIK